MQSKQASLLYWSCSHGHGVRHLVTKEMSMWWPPYRLSSNTSPNQSVGRHPHLAVTCKKAGRNSRRVESGSGGLARARSNSIRRGQHQRQHGVEGDTARDRAAYRCVDAADAGGVLDTDADRIDAREWCREGDAC